MKSENIITLHRRETIYRQGEYSTTMFEVLKGQVDIVVEQGQCFGVSGILECYPRIATAVAAQDEVVVQKITAEDFAGYFLDDQEKIYDIMRHIGGLLRRMDSDYARLARVNEENSLEDMERPGHVRAALLRLAAERDAICDSMACAGELDMAGKIR